MKLGITMYSVHKYFREGKIDMEEFIKFSGKLGLEGVDLLVYFWKEKDREMKLIPRLLEDNNLQLAAYGVGNNFVQPEEKERKKQIDYVKESIDTAAQLGAPRMRVFGGSLSREISREDALKMVSDCLAQCVDYARENRVILAIENHGGMPGTSQEVRKVIQAINSPFLKATIDIGNFLMVDEDPLEGVRNLIPQGEHVHVKDFKKKEGKLIPCIVGEGTVEVEEILKALKEEGYKNFLSLEFEGPEDDLEGVRKSLSYIKEIMSRIA